MKKLRGALVFAFCTLFFELLGIVGRKAFADFVIVETETRRPKVTAVIVSRKPMTEPGAGVDGVMMTRWHSLN